MKRILFYVVFVATAVLASIAIAHGQTVSPLTAEYSKKAAGSFVVANDSLQPMVVVVQPWGFRLVGDKPIREPLPASVTVTLGNASFIVGARQTHRVFYRARCATLPCGFALVATMYTGAHLSNGLRLALALDHAVYICDKKKNCRTSTLAVLAATK